MNCVLDDLTCYDEYLTLPFCCFSRSGVRQLFRFSVWTFICDLKGNITVNPGLRATTATWLFADMHRYDIRDRLIE